MNVLNEKILVQPKPKDEVTKGGVILPDVAQKKTCQGKVVATGAGYRNMDGTITALTINVGDTVIYEDLAGFTFKIKGVEYIVMREDEVIAYVAKGKVADLELVGG